MYSAVDSRANFSENEENVLKFWIENSIFEKSLKNRKGSDKFIFYDGPPFATGTPHYGHLLAGTIKDVVPRYQTMRGKYVERVFGWDCHGLPIEALAQESLNLQGTAEILDVGVDVFNNKCRTMVSTYVDEWEKTVLRMGRWVDFKNGYKTMDKNFMESVWWVFKQLFDKGRIYKSYRIMPYSYKLTTPLSNFEAGNNYKEVQDPAITVKAKLKKFNLSCVDNDNDYYVLLWTTTPWTLPGNLALCVGANIEYSVVKDFSNGDIYILATDRLVAYYKNSDEYKVLKKILGSVMLNWEYEPIFPYFKETKNSFRILNDDYVSTSDGTGIVHQAPAYGEDDFRICSLAGIPIVDPLDDSCAFTDKLPEYSGIFCKDADKLLIKRLKEEKKLVKHETIVHSYPFCDRTDTPLIYRAIEAWYVKVEDLHDKFTKNNDSVHWVPEYVGKKRFANWLKDAKDWNISRNRFWGSCLPIWISDNDMICVGSINELEELSGQKIEDLHKDFIDKIVIKKDGKIYKRTPEVLDCWFESGAMPYAQHHYPFNKSIDQKDFFPADFIAEGLDQTRGWFYTLMVLGTALFDRSPYNNVIVNGLILAEDGMKMSKRKKNYPDPLYIVDKYGADALRFYLMNSPVVRAESLRFSEDGVCDVLRSVILPLWNAYSFFVTYSNIDKIFPDGKVDNLSNFLDLWIVSESEKMDEAVIEGMDNYDLSKATIPIISFLDLLNNWYIRRSRRRFWKSENDGDKIDAYNTLYYVLVKFIKIIAPFIPFISETIFQNLRRDDEPISVHLCDYPLPEIKNRKFELEKDMEITQKVVSMGRALRATHNLKNRLPLKTIYIVTKDEEEKNILIKMEDIIKDELNVKNVVFDDNEEKLVNYSAKANFKVLGAKLGKNMKSVASVISELTQKEIQNILNGKNISVSVEEFGEFVIDIDSILLNRTERNNMKVLNDCSLTVALDTEITEELKLEGISRDIIRTIQNLRKEMNFEVSDRINIFAFSDDKDFNSALNKFKDKIEEETLAVSISLEKNSKAEKIDISELSAYIFLEVRGEK